MSELSPSSSPDTTPPVTVNKYNFDPKSFDISTFDEVPKEDQFSIARQLIKAQRIAAADTLTPHQEVFRRAAIDLLKSDVQLGEFIFGGTRDAMSLIQQGEDVVVAEALENFSDLEVAVAEELIKRGHVNYVAHRLNVFRGMNQSFALLMMALGQTEKVVKNLKVFKQIDYEQMALTLIVSGMSELLLQNLDAFEGIDEVKIAETLLLRGERDLVMVNLERFKNKDKVRELLKKLSV